VLLDNMSVAEAREAVALARQLRPSVLVENFCGITLENAPRLRRNGRGLPFFRIADAFRTGADLSLLVDSIVDKVSSDAQKSSHA